MLKKLIPLIALLLLAAVSCSEPTCAESTEEYRAAVDLIIEEWDDAVQIADSTARMSLSGPLGELQSINRNTKQLEVPECAAESHESLLSYQEGIIAGFLAFMGQEEDATVTNLFEVANGFKFTWQIEYERLTEE